ncbi:MAG: BglII/BstYI family type II restriction endonuclease [Brevundimonas sp.]|uniref:BglII/BstYI family type II restriction endonuclease n=1 Tax=Brevundimonas sp. TaxID=1871086 RepID=UPI00403495B6
MQIVAQHSHLNGFEFIQYHKRQLWSEVVHAIEGIDAEACKTKESQEKRKQGKGLLYSPTAINEAAKALLQPLGWHSHQTPNWVCENPSLLAKLASLSPPEQKSFIEANGHEAIYTYNQTDFIKDRVAIEFQLGKYSFVAHDLFVKHMSFFTNGDIDVGIEIVPMKSMERQMSSGVPYYERDLFNLLRQGRSTPAVPMVLIGIAP